MKNNKKLGLMVYAPFLPSWPRLSFVLLKKLINDIHTQASYNNFSLFLIIPNLKRDFDFVSIILVQVYQLWWRSS